MDPFPGPHAANSDISPCELEAALHEVEVVLGSEPHTVVHSHQPIMIAEPSPEFILHQPSQLPAKMKT